MKKPINFLVQGWLEETSDKINFILPLINEDSRFKVDFSGKIPKLILKPSGERVRKSQPPQALPHLKK